jgi:hypothetical protein
MAFVIAEAVTVGAGTFAAGLRAAGVSFAEAHAFRFQTLKITDLLPRRQ